LGARDGCGSEGVPFVFGIPVTFAGLLVGVAGRAWWKAAKRERERRLGLADHA
jgi:hypothetical protein